VYESRDSGSEKASEYPNVADILKLHFLSWFGEEQIVIIEKAMQTSSRVVERRLRYGKQTLEQLS
jgi:hypothetical protein